MMRSPEQTIGNLIDKAGTSFITYIDDEGFPVTRAMLRPRLREGIKEFWFSTNTSSNTAIKGRYYSNFKSEDFAI